MRVMLLVALGALCWAGCCPRPLTATAPPRPDGVPPDARWAGGVDGDAWIRCVPIPDGAAGPVFECTTYLDSSVKGGVWSQGRYLLGTGAGEAFRPPQRVDGPLPYAAYDGIDIQLEPQRLFLVPHGEIDYPFGDGTGKRATFDRGKQVGPEVSY